MTELVDTPEERYDELSGLRAMLAIRERQVATAQDRERQNADLLERERAITRRLSDQVDALEAVMAAGNQVVVEADAAAERIDALEAAARAVVDWATVANAIAGYPACRCCGRVIDPGWDTHRHADCPMGELAALVEEA